MQRTLSMLALNSAVAAAATDDDAEREKLLSVARLAGAAVAIHLSDDTTPVCACGKVGA